MKALSLLQPWAWLYCAPHLKDIENRTWRTNFRGRVLIHAGLSRSEMTREVYSFIYHRLTHQDRVRFDENDLNLAFGAIIGEGEIIDCVTKSNSPWFIGPFGFVRANPVLYKHPIPYKGQLGFFDVDIPESQLEAACGH